MRILILGGAGMLGHKLWQVLRDGFDTWVTVRSGFSDYARYELFDPECVLGGVDVFDFDTVMRAVAGVQPDETAVLAGIDDHSAARGIEMRVHGLLACRTIEAALQLPGIQRDGDMVGEAVPGAAAVDDFGERAHLCQKAATPVAITDTLFFNECAL